METKLSALFSVGDTLSAATTNLLFWEEGRALFVQVSVLALQYEAFESVFPV